MEYGYCWDGMCAKCHGIKKLVLGLLVLAWALWWSSVDWKLVLGGLLVLAGALKLAKPSCGHCTMSADKKKK